MAIVKVTVKMKGGNIEVDQFTDIPSAIEYFTVRDGNGNVKVNGETGVLQLINPLHKQKREDKARNARRPLSRKRFGNLIKENPEFRAAVDALLVEFGQPRLKK